MSDFLIFIFLFFPFILSLFFWLACSFQLKIENENKEIIKTFLKMPFAIYLVAFPFLKDELNKVGFIISAIFISIFTITATMLIAIICLLLIIVTFIIELFFNVFRKKEKGNE